MNIFDFDVLVLLAQTLRMATPVIFAALGATICERSGIVNLGLEGMMLMGAFFAVWGSYVTNNPWVGVLCGAAAGTVTAMVLGVWSIRFRANQVVVGVAINLLGIGVTTTLMQVVWHNKARSPIVAGLGPVELPIISQLPIVGPLLGNHSPLVYLMLAFVFLCWVLLFRTPFGLRIRAAGEQPLALASAGSRVQSVRYICVAISGGLAGLGGVCLSLSDLCLFGREMTAGRGFIGIAANVFGQWNPLGDFAASLVFGFFDAVQMLFQGRGVPAQLVQMLPYVVTILVVSGAGRVRGPEALGVAFGPDEV